jgi:hypothetical protein
MLFERRPLRIELKLVPIIWVERMDFAAITGARFVAEITRPGSTKPGRVTR